MISIHAPMKGATDTPAKSFKDDLISIHAPMKGATIKNVLNVDYLTEFQSTHP